MSLLQIVLRSLRQHMLSTVITAFSIALASGLLMSVWVVKDQARENFTGVDSGFDGVFGARGSKLQLVLNSIFHLEASPGNLTWEQYELIASDRRVATAVPIAVGDNYKGYRLVGVTMNLFEVEYREGKKYAVRDGYLFNPEKKQAVVGSFAAERLRLRVGSTFHPYHGLIFDENKQHAETYVVSGIMEPSNTPADRVIWIPIAGLQNMEGHKAETATDVSAVLVKLRGSSSGMMMNQEFNLQGNVMTFAWPIADTTRSARISNSVPSTGCGTPSLSTSHLLIRTALARPSLFLIKLTGITPLWIVTPSVRASSTSSSAAVICGRSNRAVNVTQAPCRAAAMAES